METTKLSDSLAALKQQFSLKDKPFPLSHLLYLYETGHYHLYINYMEGFRLVVQWLGPVSSPPDDGSFIPGILNTNYDSQQICQILHITHGQLFNGYKITTTLIQQQAHLAQLSKKVSTVQDEVSP